MSIRDELQVPELVEFMKFTYNRSLFPVSSIPFVGPSFDLSILNSNKVVIEVLS